MSETTDFVLKGQSKTAQGTALQVPWVPGPVRTVCSLKGNGKLDNLGSLALPFQGRNLRGNADPGYLKNGTLGYLAQSLRDNAGPHKEANG